MMNGYSMYGKFAALPGKRDTLVHIYWKRLNRLMLQIAVFYTSLTHVG